MVSVSSIFNEETYLAAECPNLYVPFRASHFRNASVLWLNERYWCSLGLNLAHSEVIEELIQALLSHFGVSTYGNFDSDVTYRGSCTTLYADRYGGTFGHNHGGSGRAGTVGRFNAKGVGVTPLVDTDADWYHSHGCMWLEEAVREAIFSELAWQSFPERANPIVAIIDTGEAVRSDNGQIGTRRAIAVRPAAVRVAHLQRNILFGDAGHEASDQYRDALRVREMISHVSSDARTHRPAGLIAQIVASLCRQIGFGRANRLFHGDYISSNICVSGALMDFGAFRGVEDWRRSQWEENSLPFGAEAGRIFETIKSVSFYVRKHCLHNNEIDQTDIKKIERCIDESFCKYLAEMLGHHPLAATVTARLQEIFEIQQGCSDTKQSDWGRLLSGLAGRKFESSSPVQCLGAAIASDISSIADGTLASITLARIQRWAAPNSHATREALSGRIETLLKRRGGELPTSAPHAVFQRPPSWLADFIAGSINEMRRPYYNDRRHELILHKRTVARSLSMTCRDAVSGSFYWRVEGPGSGTELLVNGRFRAPPTGSRLYDAGPGQTAFVATSDPSLSTFDANLILST